MINYGEMKLQAARLAGNVKTFGLVLAGQSVNDIQRDLTGYLDWSFLKAFAEPISLTAETFEYPVPDTIQRVDNVYYTDSDGVRTPLTPISDKDYISGVNEDDSGVPSRYLLHWPTLVIAPPPSASFVSTHASIYVEKVSVVVNLTEEEDEFVWPDDFETCIKYGTAGMLCLGQGDTQQAAIFAGVYQTEQIKLKTADILRYGKLLRITPGPAAAAIPWNAQRDNRDYRPA